MDQNFESMSYNGMSGINNTTPSAETTAPSNQTPNFGSSLTGNSASGTSGTGMESNAETNSGSVQGKSARLNDHAVAADLLLSAKSGVKAYADAITEASTPAVRSLLKRQLDEEIAFQDQVSTYLTKKGWYNAYNINQQILIDLNQTQDVMNQLNQ